jgi:hypothetical protein
MPGKSKHGRGKHPHKKKFKQRTAVTGIQQQPAQDIIQSAQTTTRPAPVSARPVSTAKPKAAAAVAPIETADIVSEVKRIAIFTAIIVVVLIVLSFILK